MQATVPGFTWFGELGLTSPLLIISALTTEPSSYALTSDYNPEGPLGMYVLGGYSNIFGENTGSII